VTETSSRSSLPAVPPASGNTRAIIGNDGDSTDRRPAATHVPPRYLKVRGTRRRSRLLVAYIPAQIAGPISPERLLRIVRTVPVFSGHGHMMRLQLARVTIRVRPPCAREGPMQRMTARGARISVATFCVAIAGCGTESPQPHPPSSLNQRLPPAQFCLVGLQSCLSMTPHPGRPCLASVERCAGEVRPELIEGVARNGR